MRAYSGTWECLHNFARAATSQVARLQGVRGCAHGMVTAAFYLALAVQCPVARSQRPGRLLTCCDSWLAPYQWASARSSCKISSGPASVSCALSPGSSRSDVSIVLNEVRLSQMALSTVQHVAAGQCRSGVRSFRNVFAHPLEICIAEEVFWPTQLGFHAGNGCSDGMAGRFSEDAWLSERC